VDGVAAFILLFGRGWVAWWISVFAGALKPEVAEGGLGVI